MSFRPESLNPDQAFELAAQLLKSGNLQNALALLQQVLQKAPGHEPAALALARLYYQHQQPAPAKKILENAIGHGADSFELLYFTGALQHLTTDYSNAVRTLKRAIKKNKRSHEAYNVLGSSFVELQQLDDAFNAFKKAIKIAPRHADAYNNIAWVYRSLGKKQEAIDHFQTAFQLNPNATEALSGLILLKRYQKHSPELDQADALLQSDLESGTAMELEFALGKAYEDLGNYTKAFYFFEQGNRRYRESSTYQITQDIELFKQLRDTWHSPPENTQPAETPGQTPIFIVGMPRSSTSLVEQILASHSKVFGAGELPFLESMLLSGSKLDWKAEKTDQYKKDYLEKLRSRNSEHPYVTDKMPQNFRFIGAILTLFPNAKIIHCQRHPLDTCLSLYKHHFPMTSHPYAYDQETLADYYRLYSNLMQHWHTLAPGKIYKLKYESLVNNLEEEVKNLLNYLELPFEPDCLNFHKTDRVVRTASSEQVRRGLYQSGKNQWKNYEASLAPLRSRLTDLIVDS